MPNAPGNRTSAQPSDHAGRTRVFIVDDSALMRQLLTSILLRDPGIDVVGSAPDPVAAFRKLKDAAPDVLTLDVEMPRMDGLTFLEKLMQFHPMPVVMVSSLTERGCQTTFRALELGAVDFVTKPKLDLAVGTETLAQEIIDKVKAAARARLRVKHASPPATREPVAAWSGASLAEATHKVIVVGSSTGGTEALRQMLVPMPGNSPGIVVVQHMPESFTRQFADRLNAVCQMQVKEAADGDRVIPGQVLIAPGNRQTSLHRSGAEYRVRVTMDPPVNRHRPSVEVLFESAATALGPNGVAIMLTGMGNDGARAMRTMFDAGARTIAQNEETCVVFGMPKEAIAAGGVEEILPIEQIGQAALRMAAGAAHHR